MLPSIILSVALLVAPAEPQFFQLTETKAQVARTLGQPSMVADFGLDFESWQYQIGNADHDDFSHSVVFRKSDRSIVSVTRNYEPESDVDSLFPASESAAYYFNAQYGLRLRHLSGGRVLMAMGAPKRGQLTGQLVVIRESELRYFYAWLYEQLKAKEERLSGRALGPSRAR